MTETTTMQITQDMALACALDQVEGLLRASGWSREDDVEWSMTIGRHSVFACAEEVAEVDGHVDVQLEATIGWLPWKRRRQLRVIAL